jgi:hypothetical protein
LLSNKRELHYKDCLTNEMLQNRFKSQFDLIRYAIKIAEQRILSGHDDFSFDDQSLASEILGEIAENREQIECTDCDDDFEEEVEIEEPKAKSRKKVKV